MKIATYSNVRVTNTARTTNKLSDTLKVAYKGGSVMGLCVAGFSVGFACVWGGVITGLFESVETGSFCELLFFEFM